MEAGALPMGEIEVGVSVIGGGDRGAGCGLGVLPEWDLVFPCDLRTCVHLSWEDRSSP